LKAEIVKRDQKLKEQQEQHLQKAGKNQAFDQEKQNMGNMLVSKQQEISRLSEELSFAASQILDLKEQYRVEKERVVEYESIELHNKSLMNSAQQELLQANKSIEWLNEELTRKSQQLASYRREKGDQLTLVQTQLENVLQEKSSLEVRNQLVQKRADDLEQKLSQKMEQLREFENEKILTEQQFKSEMMSQKKLADLYQKKSQELSHHNQELENLMRELENRVLKVSEEHERVISEYTDTINGLKEHTTSQEMEIEKLKAQLGTMNADLAHKATSDQIGQLSETAAAASRLQKAGKSITQVYGEYAKIQQELIKEKAEVARLQECLNHIVNEFEQRVLYGNVGSVDPKDQ
jgi:nucleoprotein TPR